jgi:3-phosphoshikimate 1-carboxyvinyltransferase
MQWIIAPAELRGTIAPPPSKSHTIRALLVATLADGMSTIRNPLLQGDGASALGAARALGAEIGQQGSVLRVKGIGGNRDNGSGDVYTGNSGTSTTLFASAAALGSRPRRFDGDQSVRSRPVRPLLDALKQLGATYTTQDAGRDVPFVVQGPLSGGSAKVNGLSSQFVSSLLFACPLLPSDSSISVVDPHEKPYIAMTLWWLDKVGIHYTAAPDYTDFAIPGNQRYWPIDLAIPADFSSATFAAVAAAVTHGIVSITGLDFSDPQGDKHIFDLLGRLGANIDKKDEIVTVSSGRTLTGQVLDLNSTPDALPAFTVAACCAEGATHLTNVAQARIKETDRLAVMTAELRKMGADITEERDGLVIRKSALHGARVNGHADHRIVMALAIAGMIAEGETVIETAESAEVTYPGFVEDFRALGAKIRVA